MTAQTLAAVELRGLTKQFGSVLANAGVNLRVEAGTIHGVIGENGAGKSTAMKLLYGMLRPDAGDILIGGQKCVWASPSDAIARGIGMVHQHFMLAGPYSALDNILLGAEPLRWRMIDRPRARARLEALARQYGLPVEWDRPIEQLPVGVQQRVEILKLLYREASILILDEPTAVLTPQETNDLFGNLRKLRAEGKTVLLVTHKLKDVMSFTDRVTVFRAGKVTGEVETARTNPQELANLMVGRKVVLNIVVSPCTFNASGEREQRASGSPSPPLEERAGERRPTLDAAVRGDIPAGCGTNISGVPAENDDLLSKNHAESWRRFPLSPSEGERAGVRGLSLPGGSGAQSASNGRGGLSLPLSSKGGEGNGVAASEHRDACKEQVPPAHPRAEPAIEVVGLSLAGRAGSRHRLSEISFSVRRGEIVGVAGVEGNGQSELLQALLHPRDSRCRTAGTVRFLGEDVTAWAPLRIRDLGVAVIPEDRLHEGLLLERPVGENFLLGLQRSPAFSRAGFLHLNGLAKTAARALADYDVRPPDLTLPAGKLSGGNQQKLIVAREFQRQPRVLIAAQPTRGVDVGAIEFIHTRIVRARDEGAGVLLVSSELDEILTLSDRILVMFEGRIVAEFRRGEVTERELGLKMGGA